MRKVTWFLCLACFCSFVVAAAPPADHSGKHAAKANKTDKKHSSDQSSVQRLTAAGISVTAARQLASQHQMIGASPLPAGIRKKLARGKPLPPGIAKKIGRPAFVEALPQHPGYEWQVVGTDLVLVSLATAVIADVLTDVFR